jgi:hypothetical protein
VHSSSSSPRQPDPAPENIRSSMTPGYPLAGVFKEIRRKKLTKLKWRLTQSIPNYSKPHFFCIIVLGSNL